MHSSQKLSPQQTERTASLSRSSHKGHLSSFGMVVLVEAVSIGDAPAFSSSLNGRFSFFPISRAILNKDLNTVSFHYSMTNSQYYLCILGTTYLPEG